MSVQKIRKATELEIQDCVFSAFDNNLSHDGATFRLYGDGLWKGIPEQEVMKAVGKTLRNMEETGQASYSYNLQSNVTKGLAVNKAKPAANLNSKPHILVLQNTALNLWTMEEEPHSKEHLATVGLPYDYDRDYPAPTWMAVIDRLLGPEERAFLQEFAGYCLTHTTKHQMMLWLLGPRGGGKSTLIHGLETMLRDLTGSLELSQLNDRFALSQIPGKTLLTATETKHQHIKNSEKLNALVTGDTITVEQKYRDAVSYKNTAKILWAMNSLPPLYDTSNGLFRRAKILEIQAIPESEQDPEVMDWVGNEGPGILNWALAGLQRLNERGKFEYPASVLATTREYVRENNLAQQFLEDCAEFAPSSELTPDNSYYISTKELTEAFNDWATARGYATRNATTLAKDWPDLGLTHFRTNAARGWRGAKIVGDGR